MEPTVVAILAATATNGLVVFGGFALWLGYRMRRLERLEQLERPQQRPDLLEARLAELTRAVDVLAVEVERMAEAQRYLALRGEPGAPAPSAEPSTRPGPRMVTPH